MPLRTPLAGRLGPHGVEGCRLPIPPSALQVWAVEDTAVQLSWGDLPAGPVTAEAADARACAQHGGGPGALVLDGLRPATTHAVRVRWDGGETCLEVTTLAPPPGELLARVATVSDLHLGATHFGFLRTMGETGSGGPPRHAWDCATAALDEARRWGAELVAIKGDVSEHRSPSHFQLAAELVDRFADVPLLVLPGNHDVDDETDEPLPATLGARQVPYVERVDHVDVPGLRVVGGNSTVPGRGPGRLAPIADELVERAADAGGPALVLLHHQLQRHRVPTHWPPAISGAEGRPFLGRLRRANPATVVSCGHSHRNRARRHGPLLVTEVGSTKDWPGVWAGYAVHEGGIRQVVRRVQAPRAIAWSEYSRLAVLGLWQRWSPGRLDERCLVHRWPART